MEAEMTTIRVRKDVRDKVNRVQKGCKIATSNDLIELLLDRYEADLAKADPLFRYNTNRQAG